MIITIIYEVAYWCGIYIFLWMFPWTICNGMYFFSSSSKRVQFLIEQCASDPEKYNNIGEHKELARLYSSGFGAGSLFLKYGLIYPFIRHRVTTNKKLFGFLMWLHWLWYMSIIIVLVIKQLGIIER